MRNKQDQNEYDLMELANAAHQSVVHTHRRAITFAIESGTVLLIAKEMVGHGKWSSFLKENFEGSDRTAQRYMRVAMAVASGIDWNDYATLHEMELAIRDLPEPELHFPKDLDVEPEPQSSEGLTPNESSEALSPEPEFDDESEETQDVEPQPAKGLTPSKKKDVDPLRDALNAIGRALGAADDEKRIEWAQILRDEIDLYMGSLDQEEAA